MQRLCGDLTKHLLTVVDFADEFPNQRESDLGREECITTTLQC